MEKINILDYKGNNIYGNIIIKILNIDICDIVIYVLF